MNPCRKTGKAVRLGGHRISINRHRGVSHYIAYMDGGAPEGDWTCITMKPYPKRGERPVDEMMARWNSENEVSQ